MLGYYIYKFFKPDCLAEVASEPSFKSIMDNLVNRKIADDDELHEDVTIRHIIFCFVDRIEMCFFLCKHDAKNRFLS